MIQAVLGASELLTQFSFEKPEWRLTDLSHALGRHPATVRRLLLSLQAHSLVTQDPVSRTYRLGWRLISLGNVALSHFSLAREAHDAMRELVAACQETAYLGTLDGDSVFYLALFESQQTLRLTARVGQRLPAHSTATGKVLLAHLPSKDLDAYLKRPRKRFTPYTAADAAVLREHLAATRRDGYAVTYEEHELGVSSVAAPVTDAAGDVIAALAVSGPIQRLSWETIPEVALLVKQAAENIGRRSGGPGVPGPTSRTKRILDG